MTHDELVEALEDHRDLWLRWTTNPTVPMVDVHALADLVLDILEAPTEEEPKRWTVNANPTPAGDPAIVLDDRRIGRVHPVKLPANHEGMYHTEHQIILRQGRVVDVVAAGTVPADDTLLIATVAVPPAPLILHRRNIVPGPDAQLAD